MVILFIIIQMNYIFFHFDVKSDVYVKFTHSVSFLTFFFSFLTWSFHVKSSSLITFCHFHVFQIWAVCFSIGERAGEFNNPSPQTLTHLSSHP